MITVIIPTLSNVAGLKQVVNWLSINDYPIVVIDNAPNSDNKKFCLQNGTTYLPQTRNIGFAAAVNLGAKEVTTPWMLILNDDIKFLNKNTLSQLIEVAKKNHWIAISPLLQQPTGETENIGYKVLPKGKVKLNYNPNLKDLDGITAAALVMKTTVFKEMKGFDERFFAYLEDVDLFLRIKKAGYEFGVATEIKVIHNHQTTSKKMGNFKAKMDLRNWWYVILKNWDKKILLQNLGPILVERLRNFSGYLKATFK